MKTAVIIAGLLANELHQTLQTPPDHPHNLYPHLQGPDRDQALFTLGAQIGAATAWRKAQHRWDPTGLAETQQAWHDAGDEAMAALMAPAVAVPHPDGPPW